MNDIFNFIMT